MAHKIERQQWCNKQENSTAAGGGGSSVAVELV